MRWRRVQEGEGGRVASASCGEVKEAGRKDQQGEEGSDTGKGAAAERQGACETSSESEGEKERAAERGKERMRVNVRDLGLEFRKSFYLIRVYIYTHTYTSQVRASYY